MQASIEIVLEKRSKIVVRIMNQGCFQEFDLGCYTACVRTFDVLFQTDME